MNVLSCFDGMSCGHLALDRAGIRVDNYYSSEIDKFALKVTSANYPNTIQLGDVLDWKSWKLEKPDLIMGGSPCQGFSKASNELDFDDPRSKLFFVFVDILNFYQPKYFLYENVKMKKWGVDIITGYLGVDPIQINSALVSGQTRKRLYWTNIPGIGLPIDRQIFLQDVLENGTSRLKKAGCLDANYHKGGSISTYSKKMFKDDGSINTVGTHQSERRLMVENDGKLRKLTPLECERLQTVPDGYTSHVSNTQRYKMLGNGWTVDVVAHILSYLPDEYLMMV